MNTNSQSSKKGSSQSSILTFFNLTSSKKPSQVKSSQKSNGLSGKRTFSEMQQTNKNDSDDVIFIKENPAISGKKRKIINDSDDDVEMIAIESTSKPKNSINDLITPKFADIRPGNKNDNIDISQYSKKVMEQKLKEDPHCFELSLAKNYPTLSVVEEEVSPLKKALSETNLNKESSTTGKKKNRKSRASVISDTSDDNLSCISNEEGLAQSDLFQNPQNGLPYFLQSENIKDKYRRSPSDPGYDPTSLYVPPEFISQQTPVMKQFWEFKKNNFDKVLFFKLGKFYELFFDDAIIGNQILELNWMGNDPKKLHVGFPEKCVEEKTNLLVREGYKVAIVEQMETPDQMKERVKSSGTKVEKCVTRELCNVFTKGTFYKEDKKINIDTFNPGNNKFCVSLVFYERNKDNEIINDTQDAFDSLPSNYTGVKLQKSQIASQRESKIEWGITIFDVTTLKYYVGQIEEDNENSNNPSDGNFTKLKTMLYNICPDEIIMFRSNIPESVIAFIKGLSCRPQLTTVKNDYEIKNLNALAQTYFGEDFEKWSDVILTPISNEEKFKATCMSLYITIMYLENILLASECLPTGTFYPYSSDKDSNIINPNKKLILDYQAISNLELIETKLDPKNPESGSLIEYLNKAATPFGRRMMRYWVLNPLCDIEQINERLNMVDDFMNNEELMTIFRNSLSKWPDLERQCSKFFKFAMNTNTKAIYFEDVGKNRLKDFFALIKFLTKSIELLDIFTPYIKQNKIKSKELIERVTLYNFDKENNKDTVIKQVPNISLVLKDLTDNFHIVEVKDEKDNLITKIESKPGVSPEYDQCKEKLQKIIKHFDDILLQEKKRLKCAVITYAHTKFFKYELEIPEEYVKKNKPKEYILTTSKKGYLRFHTQEILDNVKEMENTQEELKRLTQNLNIELFKDFYSKHKIISSYINSIAELDCISTLAYISSFDRSHFSRPSFIPLSDNNNFPYIELHESIHPCLMHRIDSFVPNDIIIGENNKPLIVITGPNMGGKSTLLRQVCVSVIMAQIGCYVPARKCVMTLVDRIFTRIGASDRILEGKSTFYIEMEETKNILQNATINSLVIMDELGRGTSTHDGKLIAKTVLDRMEKRIKCRTLFTTHYHDIISWCQSQKGIELCFMDSNVNEKTKDIFFLYKFRKGICPESYGISVAKLAGLPSSIIEMAAEISAKNRRRLQNISN